MLKDGASILPLCIVPYYGDSEIDSGEFAHKAPVLLDRFYENYKFEWDLTTKRVRIESQRLIIACKGIH